MTRHAVHVHDERQDMLLLILLCIILASVALPVDPAMTLIPCPLKSIFHIPCPGCGMTRAFILIGHFHLREAFEMNSNSLFAYALLVLMTINEMVFRLTGRQLRLHLTPRLTVIIFLLGFSLMAMGWYRNLLHERFL